MSDPENPLSRWSRRKRDAVKANKQVTAQPDAAQPPRTTEGQTAGETERIEPTFDPKSLPPIESITAETDIRAFLAPGVPPELTRAALRRAWSADPKIRDFVGLADYDWDFNAQGGATGFGPLDLTEKIRSQIVQAIQGSAEPPEGSLQQRMPPQLEDLRASGENESAEPPKTERVDNADQSCGAPTQESTAAVTRRKQGGALPK